MNSRQRYALTHPIDADHLARLDTCKALRDLGDGLWASRVLAVDR